jgi:hypothetical protein
MTENEIARDFRGLLFDMIKKLHRTLLVMLYINFSSTRADNIFRSKVPFQTLYN